jgi:hypothetical protein
MLKSLFRKAALEDMTLAIVALSPGFKADSRDSCEALG